MTPLHPDFLRIPFAHRGLHDRTAGIIENSISAFRAATNAGYAIELDVQLSADAQAMVFHDFVLDRLTGRTGPVATLTSDELAKTTLTGSNDTIQTLTTVLAEIAGRVPVLVEIKDQSQSMSTKHIGPLEQAVAAAIAGYEGPTAVMSFNPHSMLALAEISPEICRGLTTGDFNKTEYPDLDQSRLEQLRTISDFDRIGCAFISHYIAELDQPRVQQLKSQGTPIFCWTVKSPEQEAKARRTADNITFEGYRAECPSA